MDPYLPSASPGAHGRFGRRPDVERLVPNARLKANTGRWLLSLTPALIAAKFRRQFCAVLRRR